MVLISANQRPCSKLWQFWQWSLSSRRACAAEGAFLAILAIFAILTSLHSPLPLQNCRRRIPQNRLPRQSLLHHPSFHRSRRQSLQSTSLHCPHLVFRETAYAAGKGQGKTKGKE